MQLIKDALFNLLGDKVVSSFTLNRFPDPHPYINNNYKNNETLNDRHTSLYGFMYMHIPYSL